MKIEDLGKKILQKCNIYYGDALISKEKILESYIKFFTSTLSGEERVVSFALHTGSMCFDIIAVVVATLGCFAYSFITNDDIISRLKPGDMVVYKNERYRWLGIEKRDFARVGETLFIGLEQDGSGKNGNPRKYMPLDKAKHLIKPYYGASHNTGSRGVRSRKNSREEFLSYIFEVPLEEIPSEIEVSVVIVVNRNDFSDIYRNLKIEYGEGRQIGLQDIVPAAYYTSQLEEYQFGNNPTRTEPVLKATGKISAARKLVLNRQYNKAAGLLVTGIESMTDNGSELADLLRRKSLQFIHVATTFKAESGERILEQYEGAELFACTKEFLNENSAEIVEENVLTKELNRQVDNIVNGSLSYITIDGWKADDYKEVRNLLYAIKKSNWRDEKKNQFLIYAHGMLNLLTTSFFAMSKMEHAIAAGYINRTVISPEERFIELQELANIAGSMREKCTAVLDLLEYKYQELYDYSPKEAALIKCLSQYSGSKIAIVVPKAYYSDILSCELSVGHNTNNITCVTANRFDVKIMYDLIIVVGNFSGKRFDLFQNGTANNIVALLYDFEKGFYSYQRKKRAKFEHRLNNRIKHIPNDIEEDLSNVNAVDGDNGPTDDEVREFFDFEGFINSLRTLDIGRLVAGSSHTEQGTSSLEVSHVGTFTSGDQILFSKNYKAVVFDRASRSIVEKVADKLNPGDTLVFTKRDNYTKNIVDNIYENLLMTNRVDPEIKAASEKAAYWKETLREYKDSGNYSYRDIARQLQKHGCTIKEVGIRQWLMDDSHVVGPREIETLRSIASLTQDPYMLRNTEEYFEACKVVRHERRKILKLIGAAINDRLSGNMPPKGSVLEIVYDNVDNLSEMYELDNIMCLDEILIVNMKLVNRPITDSEVSM